jgi:uncharacterized protein YdeI (YjbR/CyaY-like superfamily)
MNAAVAFAPQYQSSSPFPTLAVPEELRALFDESPKMKASFWRLTDRDRRGFVRYIDEPKSVMTRERRAAIVAMSLMGLARDLRDDGSLLAGR